MPPNHTATGPGRAVVVTGVGTVSAIGIGGADTLCLRVAEGVSRIGPVRAFSTEGCPSRLGGEVGDLASHLDPQETRRLSRVSQFAVVAARLALADAGLEPGSVAGLGLVLGSEYGDFRSSEEFARGYLQRGPLGLSPMVFPNTVMNAMASQVAIAVGAQGPMLTLNQAGMAGEVAIARGALLIVTGRATAVLAGGVDELCPILYQELTRLRATSPRGSGPEGCWPFDRRANGTVTGEGATLVLLEARDRAEARGASIWAELAGMAWGGLRAPAHGFPSVRRRDPVVVHRALALAGARPEEVDVAYLTASGDPAQDECELDLLDRVFGGGRRLRPRLAALTPLVGEHAGLGGLRVATAAAVTLAGGVLPPLVGLAHPVRDGLSFATRPEPCRARIALVHGIAPGGGHVALVLGRPGPEPRLLRVA
jgi:3-oxoacyl-[acyl-carrier-protein] synthase II